MSKKGSSRKAVSPSQPWSHQTVSSPLREERGCPQWHIWTMCHPITWHSQLWTDQAGGVCEYVERQFMCLAVVLAFMMHLLCGCRREQLPSPVFWPGESHDRGAWWATVHGVAKSLIWLSDFNFHSLCDDHCVYGATWKKEAVYHYIPSKHFSHGNKLWTKITLHIAY